jgi:hypothetical protein
MVGFRWAKARLLPVVVTLVRALGLARGLRPVQPHAPPGEIGCLTWRAPGGGESLAAFPEQCPPRKERCHGDAGHQLVCGADLRLQPGEELIPMIALNRMAHLFAGAMLLSVALGDGAAGASEASAEGVASSEPRQTVAAPNPAEPYFTSVSANGSGCPPGTWEAAISPDGKAFTVTFSSYEAVLNPGEDRSVKECTLSLNVHTPPRISLSTADFHYQGYAIMDKAGMRASQNASYRFRGVPVLAQSNRSQLSGPFDNSYVSSDRLFLLDNVVSQQGANRALSGQTRLVLTNNSARTGSAYLNTTSVDGTIKRLLRDGSEGAIRP